MDRLRKDMHFNGRGLYTCPLNFLNTHHDDGGVAGFLIFINRDVVHVHAIFFGNWRSVRQPHGIAVETDFLARCQFRLFFRCGELEWHQILFENGQIVHAHRVLFGHG